MQTISQQCDTYYRYGSALLFLAVAVCGGSSDVAADSEGTDETDSRIHDVAASHHVEPNPETLVVHPVRGFGDYFGLYWPSRVQPPDVHAFEFQGGTLLLHVLVYEDYPNTPNAGVYSHPDADEGEPFREIRSSFLLGPFPLRLGRAADETPRVSIEVDRKGMLAFEADHVRLIVQQQVKRGPGSADFVTAWKSSTFGYPKDYHDLPRVRVRDYLAARQFRLPAMIATVARGRTSVELSKEESIAAGSSGQLHWVQSSVGDQTVLIAECLPFGPDPDESSLRQKIAELMATVARAPEDRIARYHLAWANYMLAHEAGVANEERREHIRESVALLRRLREEEPANFVFRDALRDHLLLHLSHNARDDAEQAEKIVEELVQLRPVAEECLHAAYAVIRSNLPADHKTRLASQMLRAGLRAGADSPSLTRANIRRFRRAFPSDRLANWGILAAESAVIDQVIEEFEQSLPGK